jgi:hypothetical protein
MATFPHRIISAFAKRVTASLEFRCGDTCFIFSAETGERKVSSIPFTSMNVHHALFNVRTVDLIQQLIERHGIGAKFTKMPGGWAAFGP